MHITAFCLAVFGLFLGFIVKFTPYRWADRLGRFMTPFEQKNFIVGKRIAQAMSDSPNNKAKTYEKLLED